MAANYKKKIMVGVVLTTTAFLLLVGVFSYIFNQEMNTADRTKELETRINLLESEKKIALEKTSDLEKKAGSFMEIGKVVEKSRVNQDPDEKNRKEGRMWIDRKTKACIVTLGAVNGISEGHRLVVFDDKKQVATVKVSTSLDVISYVEPVNQTIGDFDKDYYRVVLEQ